MKKNNTAEKTVLEAEKLSKALKEGTRQSLNDIMSEAISNIIKESDDEDLPEDEDSYEEEEVESPDVPETDEETPEEEGEDADETEDETEDDSDATEDDDWSDMEDYKIGDNDYDFTGVDGDMALKVYNKLGDDDQIFVKKEDDGTYEVKDNETGAEFVIELNADADDDADSDYDEEGEMDDDNEFELDLDGGEDDFDDDDDDEGAGEVELDFDDDDSEGDDEELEPSDDDDVDIEIEDADDDDEDRLDEEKQEFTNTYQKDVMPGLKMTEPADSKTTYSMDAGVPDGNSRPFSGYKNKESNLFTKKVNECGPSEDCDEEVLDENNISQSAKRTTKKGYGHTGAAQTGTKRHHSTDGEFKALEISEALKKTIAVARHLQKENKMYKENQQKTMESVKQLKKSLCEAAVLNVTLGQVVKILSECTTSSEEKKNIVERFSKVKTIKESKMMYDTVIKELKGNTTSNQSVMLERQIAADGNRTLNETTIYQNRQVNPSLSLMDRMDNLYKWNNK